MNLAQITSRLAEESAAAGLTRQQLGAMAGLSRTATGDILNGGDFRVSSLISLAESLGLTVVLMPANAEASAPTARPASTAPEPRQHALTVAEAARQRAEAARMQLAARNRP